ncbi:ciliogenesis-associated TTC17-interacting protein-like [Leptopilina boulardi]|uniref:ciliogenesis-associated TTC17-interacting protein-like n=1 Tax=Leptopilina boulardi TaxID=63433 RepID=UPI0021F64C10|nr:ciliogenesis-associated TTC17-interacting protein-like [Leptopilina boulardi]
MKLNGFHCGTKIIGSVTEKLQCLEEKRNEFIKKNECEEKILFLTTINNVYYNIEKRQIIESREIIKNYNLKICCSTNLLTEVGNILLTRYLALTNYQGILQFKCLTIDGKIAFCIYKCSAAEIMEYNKFSIEIYKILRIIHEKNGKIQNIEMQMLKNGRILKINNHQFSYTMEINPLENLHDIENGKKLTKFSLKDTWHEDFELLSKYLDQKSEKKLEKEEYFANHSELKNLIADYVQALLFVKPRDVLTFTIQHFLSFAKETESKDLNTNCKNIESEIFKLFPNYETNGTKFDKFSLNNVKSISIPECPACSICTSESSEICTIFSRKHCSSISNSTLYSSKFSNVN